MGNFIPISQVRDDVAAAYKKEVEWQAAEKLLPYKRMCSQRKVGFCLRRLPFTSLVCLISASTFRFKSKLHR